MPVLTVMSGPQRISQHLVELLEKEGQRILGTSIEKELGDKLPPLSPDISVFRPPARFGSNQLRENLAKILAMAIMPKTNDQELAMRVVDNVVHVVVGSRGKFRYGALHQNDFAKGLQDLRGNTALGTTHTILDEVAAGRIQALKFIPTEDGFSRGDMAQKMGDWEWWRE